MKKTKLEDKSKFKNLSETFTKNQIKHKEWQNLIFNADALLPNLGTDKKLDFELEKIELRNGKIISLKEINNFITQRPHDYHVMFLPGFYKEIYRLNNWEGNIHQRPSIVAVWTIELIYERFPKDVLPALQELNPYIDLGIRMFKHFQFLNNEGKIMLAQFINDAINEMKQHQNWYEFRKDYAQKYGFTFQLKIWPN